MRKRSELLFSIIMVPLDFLALMAAFVVAYIIRVRLSGRPVAYPIAPIEFLQIILIVLPVWILIFALSGLYNQSSLRGRLDEMGKVFVAVSGGVMFTILLDFVQTKPLFPSKSVPVYAYGLGLLFVITARIVVGALQKWLFNFGIGVHNAVIIGSGELAQSIARDLMFPRSGYRLLACVDTAKNAGKRMPSLPIYKTFEAAIAAIGNGTLDEIIQADSAFDQDQVLNLVNYATNHHIAYRFVPNQFGLYASNSIVSNLAGIPTVEIRLTPLEGWGRIAKRTFDIIGASLALLLLSPVFLVLILLVKVKEPDGPVFYKHRRLSRNGEEVQVLKFRSMMWKYCDGPDRPYKSAVEAFEGMGRADLIPEFLKLQKVENDPRVSRFGRFLRKTSLDELPQLVNVLRGDMSMVGPRPIVPMELEHYGDKSASFLALKPGATGLWVISGRSDMSYEERVKLDIYYVENWSLLLDMKIIVRTFLTILTGKGAY
jgi:exopolysaccharide biosynthesis polyprenyl glycosylphosphotransferase